MTDFGFQDVDCNILLNNPNKTLLAHEMGLGKTYIALKYLKQIYCSDLYYLIITPLYLQEYWKEKIKLILKKNCYINIKKPDKPGIYLLNYDKIKKYIIRDNSYIRQWELLIMDEANYIKNPRTIRFKGIKKLHPKKVLMLTGTPMQNNVAELWTLFNLSGADIGYLDFIDKFADKIPTFWGGFKIVGIRNEKYLQQALDIIMIRRLRQDVIKDLPDKIKYFYDLPMLHEQQKLYNKVKAMLSEEILPLLQTSNGALVINNILVKMLRLKQIADDASLIEPNISLELASNKILALDEFLRTHEKDGALVYTQFKQFAIKIAKRYHFKIINGDVPADERMKILAQLNNKEIGVVCTTQSMTYGVDAPGVSYEIFMDRLYNPKQMEQAEDRAYRIVRKESLPIIEFRSKNSIDNYIFSSNREKIATIKKVLNE